MSRRDPSLRGGLAYVCARFDEIAAIPDVRPALDTVRTAAERGEDLTEPLTELHHALRRVGDPRGVFEHEVRSLHSVPGLPPRRSETLYLCPTGGCARYEWMPGACALGGGALVEGRLPSERHT